MAAKPANYPGGGQALNSGLNGSTANNAGGVCSGGNGGNFAFNAGFLCAPKRFKDFLYDDLRV